MSTNDVTGDKIINTKGDKKKYRDNWDRIFGKTKDEMKEHVKPITNDVPHTVVANLNTCLLYTSPSPRD